MSNYAGRLRIEGEEEPPISVDIDLDGERLKVSAGEIELGDWALSELRVAALEDGFHVRVEGHEMVLDVDEDGRFALELGLKSAHPKLRQRMAALIRDDGPA